MPTHPICQHDTSLVQHPERTIEWHNYGALFNQGIHSKVQRNLLNTVMGIKGPYSKVWCIELYFMFAGPFFFQVIHNLQTDESKTFTFVKKKSRKKCQILMMMMWCIQHLYYKTRNRTSKTEVSFTFNYSQNNREKAVCQICCVLTWYLPKF